ncbi:MAG: ATP-binding protein [Acidimicrobiales bacterium]
MNDPGGLPAFERHGRPATGAGLGSHVVELQIPPRRDYLAVARRFVTAAANIEAGLADEQLSNLQVAVSEACTNAINAHEALGVSDAIAIRCAVDASSVEVVISDHGGGFDPAAVVALPEPTDPRRLDFESGLGLRLMHALADRLEIRSSTWGTAVHVVMLARRGTC